MIPSPKMKDVFMDLHADAEPFLHGQGHRGFVAGAQNILEKITEKLVKVVPVYLILLIPALD